MPASAPASASAPAFSSSSSSASSLTPASACIGRFAPSPTGPLHAGSLVAALASWLDVRARGGHWLVRIEDVDSARCVDGADRLILQQLAACGLRPDESPWWQSRRASAYAAALQQLQQAGRVYPCACTRREIEAHWHARGVRFAPGQEVVYPGTCRDGLKGRPARAWRFRSPSRIDWVDRRLGAQNQDVAAEVGDFVLLRADGVWAYQLAVVVDDAAQQVSDVVRGEDLADNTARQIALQQALGLATPRYLHLPLVRAADGRKLSKQHGAAALPVADAPSALAALAAAGAELQLPEPAPARSAAEWLARAVPAWALAWPAAALDPAALASSRVLQPGDPA